MNGKIYKIGDFLLRKKDSITLEDSEKYKRLTIKLYGKGVFLRDTEVGKKIGTKKQFTIRKGQFILSKIDARNGAFGIIPQECDLGIITGNFWSYEINKEIVDINWFNLFVSTDNFINVCSLSSSGATNRKYLNEDKFLNYELFIPNIDEQKKLIEKYSEDKVNFDDLDNITGKNQNYITQLKQSILQEAIEGKITRSWREENKDIEPASVLLEKIKAEKEELIKQKKIKKQKDLKEIDESEIPFDITKSWSWCRINDISKLVTDGSHNPPPKVEKGIPMLSAQNVFNDNLTYITNRYISEEAYLKEIKRNFIEVGDVFLTIVATIGRTCVVKEIKERFSLQRSVCQIKTFIDSQFLSYLLRSNYMFQYCYSEAKGAAQKGIYLTKLKNTIIPLPPLEEQKEIVKKVDELMKICDELEKQTLDIKENSENLMKAVLGEVFNK